MSYVMIILFPFPNKFLAHSTKDQTRNMLFSVHLQETIIISLQSGL
jgi:hypothetical protein